MTTIAKPIKRIKSLLPARVNSVLGTFLWNVKKETIYYAAVVWRRCLFRTTFIAVTGSVGKTTTKDCIDAVLSDSYPTAKSLGSENNLYGVPRAILRIRPRHKYAVIEMGTDRPGGIRKLARLVRPQVGVLVSVGRTHTVNYRDLDEIADEKGKLIESLPKGGVAVLNKDDLRVARASSCCKAAVRFFGSSAAADIVAEEVSSTWPDRLCMRVRRGSDTCEVRTDLVGKHWAGPVLAALLVAGECNITLKEAAASLKKIRPYTARMQPAEHPSGAVFLRDEQNGSLETLEKALDVVREGSAGRKILVMSNVSDHPDNSRVRMRHVGRLAAGVVDVAVFIDKYGNFARKEAIQCGMDEKNVFHFAAFQEASVFLKENLRSGDLVLLKGRSSDHLERVYLSQFCEIHCGKKSCSLKRYCDFCEELKG
jgi:UDP-N-acetylmuramoyl-tripeptide--D-alanyl-D-alanine ligase